MAGRGVALGMAQGLLDRCLNLGGWFGSIRHRFQAFGHLGDIRVDGGQAIEPVATLVGLGAVGDVGNIDALRGLGKGGPDLSRSAVSLQGLSQGGAISGLVVNCVERSTAELGGEKQADADLQFEISGYSAEVRARAFRPCVFPLPPAAGRRFRTAPPATLRLRWGNTCRCGRP